jgi:hypothetical protein
MAKFSGLIGYGMSVETKPDVWQDVIVEHFAYGDVLRNTRGLNSDSDKVNLDLSVGNSISIVADEFANGHIFAMKYVMWRGARWIVTDVQVEPPRLILRLGGLYNGRTP